MAEHNHVLTGDVIGCPACDKREGRADGGVTWSWEGEYVTFDYVPQEVCWGCQQIARFYPEFVPESVLGEVQGADIPLCGICWTWWVPRWVNSDEDPGCRSHLIEIPNRTNRSEETR